MEESLKDPSDIIDQPKATTTTLATKKEVELAQDIELGGKKEVDLKSDVQEGDTKLDPHPHHTNDFAKLFKETLSGKTMRKVYASFPLSNSSLCLGMPQLPSDHKLFKSQKYIFNPIMCRLLPNGKGAIAFGNQHLLLRELCTYT